MGEEAAHLGLRDFDVGRCVENLSGTLAADPRLALGQIESTTYLRNQLLRDSDWASMDHSVELRTPLVDAWLLHQLSPLLPAFARFPNKALLAGAPAKPLPGEVIRRPKTGFGIPVGSGLPMVRRRSRRRQPRVGAGTGRCLRGEGRVKLVHVVPHVDEEAAGPSYSVPRLCESLAARGHDVELSCLAARGAIPGVRLDIHPQWPFSTGLRSRRVTQAHCEEKVTKSTLSTTTAYGRW